MLMSRRQPGEEAFVPRRARAFFAGDIRPSTAAVRSIEVSVTACAVVIGILSSAFVRRVLSARGGAPYC